jgi:predicted component of type VI protein secretion system
MESKLLITSGTTSQRWVALRLPTVLGRGREASLTVPHPLISRRHCELFEQDGLLMLRDLGSLNGTMVEGRRVALAPLPPGAEFTVGPLTFQAHYEYEGDPAAIPPAQFLDEPRPSVQPSIEGEAASAAEEELPEFLAVEGPAASPAPDIADSQPEIPVVPVRKKEPWSSPVGGPPEKDLPDEDAQFGGFLDDLE